VSSYDALGSVMAMPVGALVAGPVASVIGVSATQYGAAALILVATVLALIPRDVRAMRSDYALPAAEQSSAEQWPDDMPQLDDGLVGGGARR
jgi:hypothetical protein